MSKEYYRRKPYVEDSTKGGSMINPLNYKGDVLVQVWMDSRVLATLALWLESIDVYPRFMSQVVRRPLEVVAETLVSNGEAEMVDDTVEARKMLERMFGVDLNRGGRGSKNVAHNIVLSERREELAERIRRDDVRSVSMPMRKKRSVISEKAMEKYQEMFGDGRKEKMNGIESKELVVKEKMNEVEFVDKMEEIEKENEIVDRELDEFLNTLKKKKE